VTLHIPGIVGTGGVTGEGAKLMIRLQFGRGQATRWDELLHISKQLHGHLTYFLPGGALLYCKEQDTVKLEKVQRSEIEVGESICVHLKFLCVSSTAETYHDEIQTLCLN
jgi:hypothetical protein